MKKKSLTLNAGLSSLNTCVSIIFPLISFPYISRVLQVDNVGAIDFGTSIIGYFTLIAAFGINAFAIRNGAAIRENQEKLSRFASQIFTINTITALIACVLLVILVFLPTQIEEYRVIILIQGLPLLFYPLSVEWAFSIVEDFAYITVRNIIARTISLVLLFIFVRKQDDVIPYVLIFSLTNCLIYVLNFLYARKYIKIKWVRDTGWNIYHSKLWIFFVNSIASTIYLNSDTTMLGLMCGDTAVGLYASATKIYTTAKMIVNAAVMAIIPRMAFYATNDKERFGELLNKLLKIALFITLPMTAGLVILHKDAVLLISGETYKDAATALLILAFALGFATLANIFANGVLISLGKEKYVLRATLVSAAVNLGLNFIFVPLMKQNGAALTTLIAEIIMLGMSVFYARKEITDLKFGRTLLNTLIGVAVMVGAAIALSLLVASLLVILRVIIIVLACCVIYFVVELILKEEVIYDGVIKIKNRISKSK